MDCRLSLAQTNPVLGDLQANLAEHLAVAEEAAAAGSQLVAFPELSLTGYFLRDMALDLAIPADSPTLEAVAERSRDVSIALGFVERSPEGRVYNTYALFEDGRLVGRHRKVHLVTYGMFEESRDLAAGEHFRPIESRHGRLGVLVCEDAWHLGGLYLHFLANCDAILVPSSSPARGAEAPGPGFASTRTWNTLLDAAALSTRTWVAYVNRVGFEDGIGFGGGTRVVGPTGDEVAAIGGLEAARLDVSLESAVQNRARGRTPLRRDEKPWVIASELAHWREGAPGEEAEPGEAHGE
jgi:predicted amidohydrolase